MQAVAKTDNRAAWVAAMPGFWAMFTVGVASAIVGPSLPVLVKMYDLSWSEAGQVFSAQFGGKLAAVLLLSLWEWRFAARTVATIGGLLLSIGLFLTALSPGWLPTLAAVVLFGFGHGGVDAGFNAVFADMYAKGPGGAAHAGKWLNKLHMLFGIGALIGPLLVTVTAYNRPWWGAFALTSLFALAIPCTAFLSKLPADRVAQPQVGAPAAIAKKRIKLSMGVALAAVICFLYGGLETALGGWIYTFLTEGASLPGTVAAFSVTLFWALLMIGRFASVWGISRMGALRWIGLLALILCGSLALGVAASYFGMLAIVVALAGLGLSGIFPTIIAWVTGGVAKESAQVVAWLIASSSLGAVAVPWLVGIMADWRGILASFTGLLLLALLLLGVVYLLQKRENAAAIIAQ